MRYRSLFLTVWIVVSLTACSLLERQTIRGSGDIETTAMEFSGFNRLDISHSFDVEISQGDSFRVVVRSDDNIVEHLDVRKSGNTLFIGLDPELLTLNNVTLEAEVAMPELSGIELSGASSVDLQSFRAAESLEVSLSGASRLTGELEVEDLTLDVSGASKVTLEGSGEDLTAEVSGASEVALFDFQVQDATLNASGASDIEVWASDVLDAQASGASDIVFRGDPETVREETSGASSVKSQ